MTDSLYVNAYTTLGVAQDVSSIEIKAAYRRRLVELQRKRTQPREYALLLNSYRRLADPKIRAEIDRDLARQRAERNGVVEPPAITKRRHDPNDPKAQYDRLIASAKTSRTRTRTETGLKFDRTCNEADDALSSGRISSLDHDEITHFARSAYHTKLDAIEAKFTASATGAAKRFGQTSGTVQGNTEEQTA